VFFFSSRRRHTRSYGDWSSDVCSSDLLWIALVRRAAAVHHTDAAVELQRDGAGARDELDIRPPATRQDIRVRRRRAAARRELEAAGRVDGRALEAEPRTEVEPHAASHRDRDLLLVLLTTGGLHQLGRGDVDADGRGDAELSRGPARSETPKGDDDRDDAGARASHDPSGDGVMDPAGGG